MKTTMKKVQSTKYNVQLILAAVLFYCLLLLPTAAFPQNVGISAAGIVPDNSAMLDVVSTTRGMLIPRLTTAQRNAIASPATGLEIFNTDCGVFNYYNSTCWITTSKALPDPGPITASTTDACAATVATYSVPAVTGATTYIWTVPAGASITGQGTTSISVTFGNFSGKVCVKANNACESSSSTCIDVEISPIPNTPGNITGPISLPPGENPVTYFIASVEGASVYNWTVPPGASITSGGGTTTITVNYSCTATSGSVTVTAQSSCGISAPSSLAVTVTPLLAASAGANRTCNPGLIGASPTATGGEGTYTYAWSPATGLNSTTLANPTSTATSTITYTVTVTDANGCTANSSMTITLSAPPLGTSPLTIAYTGALQSFTVPCGVTSITFDVYGAQGATSADAAGGLGGRAQGSLTVTPGATINVYVGGQGGFNGGGAAGSTGCRVGVNGGGASDIRVGGTALANRVIVGGAGGGGGTTGCSWAASAGGVGGGTTGDNGNGCCGTGPVTGGSQVGGGSTGTNGCGCGLGGSGSLGTGGNGGPTCSGYGGSSGGGGGYYGGGGGFACGSGWSGGGGSSYTGGVTGGSTTSGVRSGNGQVVITY